MMLHTTLLKWQVFPFIVWSTSVSYQRKGDNEIYCNTQEQAAAGVLFSKGEYMSCTVSFESQISQHLLE